MPFAIAAFRATSEVDASNHSSKVCNSVFFHVVCSFTIRSIAKEQSELYELLKLKKEEFDENGRNWCDKTALDPSPPSKPLSTTVSEPPLEPSRGAPVSESTSQLSKPSEILPTTPPSQPAAPSVKESKATAGRQKRAPSAKSKQSDPLKADTPEVDPPKAKADVPKTGSSKPDPSKPDPPKLGPPKPGPPKSAPPKAPRKPDPPEVDPPEAKADPPEADGPKAAFLNADLQKLPSLTDPPKADYPPETAPQRRANPKGRKAALDKSLVGLKLTEEEMQLLSKQEVKQANRLVDCLKGLLKPHGLKVRDVFADGLCLFHSACVWLHYNLLKDSPELAKMTSIDLKNVVLDHLASNYDKYSDSWGASDEVLYEFRKEKRPTSADWTGDQVREQLWISELNGLRNNTTWSTTRTAITDFMVVALSAALKIRIVLYSVRYFDPAKLNVTKIGFWDPIRQHLTSGSPAEMSLGFVYPENLQSHYVSLFPSEFKFDHSIDRDILIDQGHEGAQTRSSGRKRGE